MASTKIERQLYNGKFEVVHNPNARGSQPRYLVNGIRKPKGVTTILGATLAKDLMQWAVDCAVQYLKEKLPEITEGDLNDAGLEYTRRRDSGGSTGTEAHALVENYLKGVEVDHTIATSEARQAFLAFRDWYEMVQPTVINVEEVIFSEAGDYAGTYDCLLRIDGKVYLCDLKTTNPSRKAPKGVYAENFVQLGAYALAHEEQRQYEEAHGGTDLVIIDDLMVISAKKDGTLDIITASDVGLSVDECGEMFRQVNSIYRFMTDTTRTLGGR